jgi:hypothetical protein
MFYWANPSQGWGVSQVKTNLGHVNVWDGVRDVWARGAVITGKCRSCLWVSLWRVSCTFSWMPLFSSPFNAFYSLSYCFFFSRE